MMGSGTVLAIARSTGHRSIGVDIDPLAVLISRVWTTAVDYSTVMFAANQILKRAAFRSRSLRQARAYPPNADDETKRFVRYWFDPYARRQLAALALTIRGTRDDKTRAVLWCAFSRLIITKQTGASRAMDLSHSRPHRVFERAPLKPLPNFLQAVDRTLVNCISSTSPHRGPAPRVYRGDARFLPLNSGVVDLVVTSPPYLNAIDYMRCSKFSLVWMGHTIKELRQLRATSIGSEVGWKSPPTGQRFPPIGLELNPPLPPHDGAILQRYANDISSAVAEVSRVLTNKGRAVYVVGENTIRNTFIATSALVEQAAESSSLVLCGRSVRALEANRRYLPPPRITGKRSLDNRIRQEVILTFEKRG